MYRNKNKTATQAYGFVMKIHCACIITGDEKRQSGEPQLTLAGCLLWGRPLSWRLYTLALFKARQVTVVSLVSKRLAQGKNTAQKWQSRHHSDLGNCTELRGPSLSTPLTDHFRNKEQGAETGMNRLVLGAKGTQG